MLLKISAIFVVLMVTGCVLAQPTGLNANEWIRVQSDDGQFSVDLPRETVFFYNKDGYFTGSDDYRLREMYLADAYIGNTLVSLESYGVPGGALDERYEKDTKRIKRDKEHSKDFQESVIKRPGYSIRQTLRKINAATVYRQYIAGKDRIYILTTASRNGETETMRRFLDSVSLSTFKTPGPDPNVLTLSKVPKFQPVIEMRLGGDEETKNKGKDNKSQSGVSPTSQDPKGSEVGPIMLITPSVTYTNAARTRHVTGTVRLRLTLSAYGNVSKIVVLRTLPEGLLRQAIFGALQIKFLPREKNNVPEAADITREYSFDIY